MPSKNTSNSQTSTNGSKPSLSWRVMIGGQPSFTAIKPNDAVRQATPLLRAGVQGVTIQNHNGTEWVHNEEFTQKAIQQSQGVGNTNAATALAQLAQHATALGRAAKTKNGFNSADVNEFLNQVFLTCKAMGVTDWAIEQTFKAHYAQPAEV